MLKADLIRSLIVAAFLCLPSAVDSQGRGDSAATQTLQTRVWVNLSSKVYHCPGTRYYGVTRNGEFMVEAQARGFGHRAAGGRGCAGIVTAGPAPLPDTAALARQMVWVNTESRIYHCPGSSDWGTTRRGRYLAESAAAAAGHKPGGGKKCS